MTIFSDWIDDYHEKYVYATKIQNKLVYDYLSQITPLVYSRKGLYSDEYRFILDDKYTYQYKEGYLTPFWWIPSNELIRHPYRSYKNLFIRRNFKNTGWVNVNAYDDLLFIPDLFAANWLKNRHKYVRVARNKKVAKAFENWRQELWRPPHGKLAVKYCTLSTSYAISY